MFDSTGSESLLKLEKPEVRDAIVLFCDIRGFSDWSKNYQHEIQDLLEITYSLAYEIFGERREQRFPKRVVKFTGDGFLAVQEYAPASADDLRAACLSVFKNCHKYVRLFRDRLSFSTLHGVGKLSVGFGAAFGKCLRFFISGGSLDYVGDRVNYASRLVSVAGGNEVLAEEDFEDHIKKLQDEGEAISANAVTRELKKIGNQSVLIVKCILDNETIEAQTEMLFSDDFDSFLGWEQYLDGNVSRSKEVKPRVGQFCLKKGQGNDPHGGYKIIGRSIDLGFIFSGWIYRPSGKHGGKGDRLGIEDARFNGYGFSIAHGAKFAAIERRDQGKATEISERIHIDPPEDTWYQFEFHSSKDGKFVLFLNNSQGDRLFEISAVDLKYNRFDRIVIHGGQPYFVDNLRVVKM